MAWAATTTVYNPFTGRLDFTLNPNNLGNVTGTTMATTGLICQGSQVLATDSNGNFVCQLDDSGSGGSGTVTSISQGTGMSFSVNPITTTGTINLATPVAVANGGTGVGTFTPNGVLYGNATTSVLQTAQGGANSLLTANAGAPSFSQTPTVNTSLTIGVGSTTTGQLVLRNSTNANSLTLQPGATGSALTFTLPTADGTNNQSLVTNGSAALSWANVRFLVGNRSGTSITVTTYYPFFSSSTTSATAIGTQVAFQMICRNLYAKITTAPGAGNSWTVRPIDDAGANLGTIVCTISGASATSCNDTTNTTGTLTAGSGVKIGFVAGGTPVGTGVLTESMECEAN